MGYKYIDAESLVGKTVTEAREPRVKDSFIGLKMSDGSHFIILHNQDCCESVELHDSSRPIGDLIGAGPIVSASKDENREWPGDIPQPDYLDSFTITTIILATATVEVRLRFIGTSNGYYGEGVDIEEV